jgi:hypothetical protein
MVIFFIISHNNAASTPYLEAAVICIRDYSLWTECMWCLAGKTLILMLRWNIPVAASVKRLDVICTHSNVDDKAATNPESRVLNLYSDKTMWMLSRITIFLDFLHCLSSAHPKLLLKTPCICGDAPCESHAVHWTDFQAKVDELIMAR